MGRESKPEVPEKGRRQNTVVMQNPDLTRFNSPQNRTHAAGPGNPRWALETMQRRRQIWSLPLRGSQSSGGSKADPKPGIHNAGRWGCAKRSPGRVGMGVGGGSGSTMGDT